MKVYIYVEHNGLYIHKAIFLLMGIEGVVESTFKSFSVISYFKFYLFFIFYNRAINSELLFNIKFYFTFYCRV